MSGNARPQLGGGGEDQVDGIHGQALGDPPQRTLDADADIAPGGPRLARHEREETLRVGVTADQRHRLAEVPLELGHTRDDAVVREEAPVELEGMVFSGLEALPDEWRTCATKVDCAAPSPRSRSPRRQSRQRLLLHHRAAGLRRRCRGPCRRGWRCDWRLRLSGASRSQNVADTRARPALIPKRRHTATCSPRPPWPWRSRSPSPGRAWASAGWRPRRGWSRRRAAPGRRWRGPT